MRPILVRFSLLFVLLGFFIFLDGGAALALPRAENITPAEFWQRVEQSLSTLRRLKTQPKESVAPALEELAVQWDQLKGLTLPDNATVPLDASLIVSQLRKSPYDLDLLIQRFTDLQNARNITSSNTFGAKDLNALQEILQGPEFEWDRPPSPIEELWNQFWARFQKWFNGLAGDDQINVPVPGEIFTVGASIILLLILLYVFRNLFSDFFLEASAKDEQLAGDELLTAESALQKAKDISRGGDYRTAVRYLYISSLLTLDERGLMRFDRSKTNREYLRSVAAFPQLSAPLREVIDVFDRVWYGFQPLDEENFQHYAEKVDQLREQKK